MSQANRELSLELVNEHVGDEQFVVEDYEDVLQSPLSKEEEKNIKKFESLKVLLEEFMSKRDELKEFEEELQKHKDELTPGTIGES